MMPGRRFEQINSAYRYGFNGKEKDNDIEGQGNIYDYGFRVYNPRLGKFLSVDPLGGKFPYYTPYQYAGNRPIELIDIDGLEGGKKSIWQTIWDALFGNSVSQASNGADRITEGITKQMILPKDIPQVNEIANNPNAEYDVNQSFGLRKIEGQLEMIDGTAQLAFAISDISNTAQTIVEIPLIIVDATKTLLKKSVTKDPFIKPLPVSNEVEEIKRELAEPIPVGTNNPKVKEALDYGNQMHKELTAKAKAKGWTTGKRFTDPKTGKPVIPDIVTPSGHPLEYKPKTPSGIKKGKTQLKGQERATGTNGRVIYYEPKKKT